MSKRFAVQEGAATVTVARGAFGGGRKRPIDKRLKFVNKSGQDGTQAVTTLYTTTFPGTVVGLRWSISCTQDGGTANTQCVWAIVVVRDGLSAQTMGLSDAADFYTPEGDVLTFGIYTGKAAIDGHVWEGSTKAMRKLQAGDLLQWIVVAEGTNTFEVKGIIQFFIKT